MLSLKHRFLFIHIPKTGGNSIQKILRAYSEDQIVSTSENHDGKERFEVRSYLFQTHKHSKLKDYKTLLPPAVFENVFKFACVRNPWDRLISYYFSPFQGEVDWDRNRFIESLEGISPLQNFAFLQENDKGFGNIDFYLRFENLSEDFKKVCTKLGLPEAELPTLNKAKKQHYTSYYDEELVEIVREKCKLEISHFGFEYPKV